MLEFDGHKFYTVLETAEQLDTTPQTIRNYIRKKKLKARRVGRQYYIAHRNILELLGIETKQKLQPGEHAAAG